MRSSVSVEECRKDNAVISVKDIVMVDRHKAGVYVSGYMRVKLSNGTNIRLDTCTMPEASQHARALGYDTTKFDRHLKACGFAL